MARKESLAHPKSGLWIQTSGRCLSSVVDASSGLKGLLFLLEFSRHAVLITVLEEEHSPGGGS
jgi:hypothetical protein